VGAEGSKIVLTARSGRSATGASFQKLGYTFNRNDIDFCTNRSCSSRQKKEIEEEDLHQLARAYKPEPAIA